MLSLVVVYKLPYFYYYLYYNLINGPRDTSFILLIGTGDLLVGTYLLAITTIDQIKSKNYCQHRYDWLGDYKCTLLGVISTAGSQISLFTMTVLSFYRLNKIKHILHSRSELLIN